jgi:hypothetical protein
MASTNDTGEIYRAAVAILDGVRLHKSVRLFGVTLSRLAKTITRWPSFKTRTERREPLWQRPWMASACLDLADQQLGDAAIAEALLTH